jgi:hypothetical protein
MLIYFLRLLVNLIDIPSHLYRVSTEIIIFSFLNFINLKQVIEYKDHDIL